MSSPAQAEIEARARALYTVERDRCNELGASPALVGWAHLAPAIREHWRRRAADERWQRLRREDAERR